MAFYIFKLSICMHCSQLFVGICDVLTGGEYKGWLSIAVNFNSAGERQKTSKTV